MRHYRVACNFLSHDSAPMSSLPPLPTSYPFHSPSSHLSRNKVNDRLHCDYSYPYSFTLQYRHSSLSGQHNPVAPTLSHTSFTSSLYHHNKNIPNYHQYHYHSYKELRAKGRPNLGRRPRGPSDCCRQSSIGPESFKQMSIVRRSVFPLRRVPQESICSSPHKCQDWGHWI